MSTTVASTIGPEDYRQMVRLKLLLLAFLGCTVFLNGLLGVFVHDDLGNIVNNPDIRHLSLSQKAWLSSQRLVTWTLAVNYAISQERPWSYHLVNIVLHMLAALTLFGVVCRVLLCQSNQKQQEAASWLAFAVALLWMIHPLQTQSVTYLSERAEALMGLFYFLTLYGLVRSTDDERGWLWRVLAFVACALGMGIRPAMVTAPLVALLFDRIYLADSVANLWRRRALLYPGLAACWGLLAIPLLAGVQETPAPPAPFSYLLTQPGAILHYLRLVFWPVGLSVDYFDYPLAQGAGDYLAGLLVLAVLLAVTGWCLYRRPKIGFLGMWFFLTLFPSVLLLSADPVNETRMYLPLAAVSALLVLGGFALVLAGADKLPWLSAATAVLGVALASGLGVVTFLRNYDYAGAVDLWRQTVGVRPGDVRAHLNLGNAYTQALKYDLAADEYRTVLEAPAEGRIKDLQQAALNNIGMVLLLNKQADEARKTVTRFATADLNGSVVLNNLGFIRWTNRDSTEAARFFEAAAKLSPETARYRFSLALALKENGKTDQAAAALKEGLRLDPDWPHTAQEQAWLKATHAEAEQRNAPQAIFLALQACLAGSDQQPEALDTLAAAFASSGRFNEAIDIAEQAHTLATAKNKTALARAIQERLPLYKVKKTFVERPTHP